MALAGTPCEPWRMRHVPLHEPVRTVWYGIEQTYQGIVRMIWMISYNDSGGISSISILKHNVEKWDGPIRPSVLPPVFRLCGFLLVRRDFLDLFLTTAVSGTLSSETKRLKQLLRIYQVCIGSFKPIIGIPLDFWNTSIFALLLRGRIISTRLTLRFWPRPLEWQLRGRRCRQIAFPNPPAKDAAEKDCWTTWLRTRNRLVFCVTWNLFLLLIHISQCQQFQNTSDSRNHNMIFGQIFPPWVQSSKLW